MVYPVSGPFVEQKFYFGPPNILGQVPVWKRYVRVWSRQKPPFNLELPYAMANIEVIDQFGGDGTDLVEQHLAFPLITPDHYNQRVYNKAYTSFMEKVRVESSTLGATLGEWKSSSSMISARATQLWQGFKAAKRLDFRGVKRAWGKHAGIRPKARAAGNHVLEYSFGWAPLVKDINSALEVLHNRLPPFRVKQRAKYGDVDTGSHNFGAVTRFYTNRVEYAWELRGQVELENPNTALAQQLGLVNLGSVVWELLPNSYILDYFVNVSDFIGAFSDRVGINFVSEAKTNKVTLKTNVTGRWNPPSAPPYSPFGWNAVRVDITRTLGLPGPTLALRLPWKMSTQRASTSIARLLQQLKG